MQDSERGAWYLGARARDWWGLLKHYSVLFKMLITIVATVLLLVHMQPTSYMARITVEKQMLSADLRSVRFQLVVDAGAALVVLFVATVLSMFKPRGLTPYGRRKQQKQRTA